MAESKLNPPVSTIGETEFDITRVAPASGISRGEPILSVRDLSVTLSKRTILDNLNVDVMRGEVISFVGGSGTGKTVLMRAILGLLPVQKGDIQAFGLRISEGNQARRHLGRRWGVLFQHGALFSSLTVRENIQVPMKEYFKDLSPKLMDELALLKIELVGLARDAADKMPSELSGGMIKRAALARALALDPSLVFLDEPTSGLDPVGAADFDNLMVRLRDTLGLTVYMVTHDLDSIAATSDRVAVLAHKKVLTTGTLEEVANVDDPWIKDYFGSERALRVRAAVKAGNSVSTRQ